MESARHLSMGSLRNPDHIIHPLDFPMNFSSTDAMMPSSEMYMQHTPSSVYSATDFLLLDYDEMMSPRRNSLRSLEIHKQKLNDQQEPHTERFLSSLSNPSFMDGNLPQYDMTPKHMMHDQSPHSQKKTSMRKASTVTKVKTPGGNAFVNKDGKLIRGKPCDSHGCGRRAQSRGHCKLHGGGARCKFIGGCSKSSQGGGYCRSHGGGKKCVFLGCCKGQQRNQFCFQHGGNAQGKFHAAV